MSTQPKKFICSVASLVLSVYTTMGLVWVYFSVLGGMSFGGELIFIAPPIFLAGIFSYYFLLKKIFNIY